MEKRQESEAANLRPAGLRDSINKRWIAYALAAGGALGTIPSAQASNIVTTHTNVSFSFNDDSGCSQYGVCPWVVIASVDFNNGGKPDFQLWGKGGFNLDITEAQLRFGGNSGAGVMSHAAVLKQGAFIGPGRGFAGTGLMVFARSMFYDTPYNTITGPWRGLVKTEGTCNSRGGYCTRIGKAHDGYFGVRFDINGQAHYGWVELSLTSMVEKGKSAFDGDITEFAYDTVAGQGLYAGQTGSTPADTRTPEPGTLGLLALGSIGLGLWRKKRSAN